MALTYLGSKSSEVHGTGVSFGRTYDAAGSTTHTTITHRHAATGMTFVFEYGNASPTTTGGTTQPSIVTGVDPSEIHNALYGKIIPLSALGPNPVRIGTAGLIFGPYGLAGGTASFGVSFGFPANPEGTRRVYEIALDGKVAWELASGSPEGALNPAGFLGDSFQCRFYSGTMTQGADPLEAAMFGAEAVAYRPQMMLWFTDLPVAAFDNKVPFVSCKIGDVTDGPGDGINLGEVLKRIAYSPWLEYDSSTFQTEGVADIVQAMILTEDQSFLDLLRVTARVYRTLDILQTDMLRVNDRGSTVTPDLILHRDHVSADGGVQYLRQEESSVARELELTTIDPDADFVFMPNKAARPLAPVAVTSSVAKESIVLPVVVGATTRAALVTYAKYEEDNARKRVSLQTLLYGYALEPGDLFRLTDIADGFDNAEVWKVVESSHGANYINEISAEAILKCTIDDVDPYFSDVIILLHADTSSPAVLDHSQYAEAMHMEGALIDTTAKFGVGSFLFDGTDDEVGTVDNLVVGHDRWDLDETDFTIEVWVRFARVGHSDDQTIICRYGGVGFRCWALYNHVSSDELTFTTWDGVNVTSSFVTSGANLATGVWYHIAVDKDSTGQRRIYVDGVMRGSTMPVDPFIDHLSEQLTLGRYNTNININALAGWIDDVRITVRSRYGDLYGDGSFPVPSGPYPDHA